MRQRYCLEFFLASILILGLNHSADASEDRFKDVVIEKTRITNELYMLQGQGGNIALLGGPDGVVMVDDQFAALSKRLLEASRSIFKEDIRFVINTHHHGDHTGGNEFFGARGSTILSHVNVRGHLLERLKSSDISHRFSLPILTFEDTISLHVNKTTIRIKHLASAHTDGDAIVWFQPHDAVHLGDIYFNGKYPYIDVDAGGEVEGLIAAIKLILSQVGASTKIIPGHGALSNRDELQEYLFMLETIRNRALIHMNSKNKDSSEPSLTRDFDAKWDGGFISSKRFQEIVLRSLRNRHDKMF